MKLPGIISSMALGVLMLASFGFDGWIYYRVLKQDAACTAPVGPLTTVLPSAAPLVMRTHERAPDSDSLEEPLNAADLTVTVIVHTSEQLLYCSLQRQHGETVRDGCFGGVRLEAGEVLTPQPRSLLPRLQAPAEAEVVITRAAEALPAYRLP